MPLIQLFFSVTSKLLKMKGANLSSILQKKKTMKHFMKKKKKRNITAHILTEKPPCKIVGKKHRIQNGKKKCFPYNVFCHDRFVGGKK